LEAVLEVLGPFSTLDMKTAVAASCLVGCAVASPSADVLAKFEEFRTKWGRVYMGDEYAQRVKYFENHVQTVSELQRQEIGTAIYTYLGPFADLSPEEMSQRFGLLPQSGFEQIPLAPLMNGTLGTSFDWVAKGAVNPVKDQGQCGSCWAFSTACNLEGAGFVSTGKLISASEQNIMDCDKSCYSCRGGLPSLALTWSSQNGGVASEASYPYKAEDESCRSLGAIVHNKGYVKISQDEDQIAQALAQYGPLSIAVDATPFQSYHGGVMNNPSCSKTKIDHAVNIVGYGETTIKYWKIRNSWAASWGEEGYIRVSRGHCTCALCTTVVSATGVTVSNSPTPTPPAPPPTPSGCSDEISNCPSGGWECEFLASVCQKSCGCCSASPPSYCARSALPTSQGIFDEILKLVCQAMENGSTEPQAEQLICSHLKINLEVEGCDKVVELLWSTFENKECPAASKAHSVVV